MPVVTIANGKSFACGNGVSILDAAEAAGFSLPYSCRSGRCSSCECVVSEGESELLSDELGKESEGTILACVRTPVSDLTLDLADLSEWNLHSPKTFPCRISSLDKLADDVLKVILRLPPKKEFGFMAGQYVDLIGPDSVRRSYSIANRPRNDNTIELHIRKVDGGAFSQYWFDLAKENDLLRLYGPLGTFFMRDIKGLDLVFLATGTGFAPVKSMLESIVELPQENMPRSISVYWGGRHPADLYSAMEINEVAINFIPVLSRGDSAWTGRRGYVQQHLMDDMCDFSDVVVYACGSDAMISDARDALIKQGLHMQRFYSDAFVCSSKM